jgi:hypothetical protein
VRLPTPRVTPVAGLFLLVFTIIALPKSDPERRVLQYIRENLRPGEPTFHPVNCAAPLRQG